MKRVSQALTALLASFLVGAGALANGLDGVLEVSSAYVNVDHGVFKLHARVQYPENEDIRVALNDGVTLMFDVEAVIARERRYWFDADVVSVTLRRELSYHAVSNRYVVRGSPDSATQESYATLHEALEAIGAVDDWPVLVEPQLSRDARYRVSVRASVRRGRLPDTLRVLMFWTDSWHRTSEWYSWSLPV
ncbi:MAG: DUF4390 domain-containing protein [Steroidobacteraceae bacterium]|jgi:hypothetical protein|nr:DUF4390 domain-containing protein [Steroidobacteraceae bacterium]